jgi:hypothetical protein
VRLVSTNPDVPGVFAFGQIAVGVIAVGQFALGVVAVGQVARGVIAVGQAAIGVIALGQGAIGLYHGTGMVALAGPRGYGLALHLLPRAVREPPADLPTALEPSALLERRVERGWLRAELGATGGEARVALEGASGDVDTSALRGRLAAAWTEGNDRVHLLVRAEAVSSDLSYRASDPRVRLVAEDAIPHRSRPRWQFTYAAPPLGRPRFPVTPVSVTVRSIAYVLAAAVFVVVTLVPLLRALF